MSTSATTTTSIGSELSEVAPVQTAAPMDRNTRLGILLALFSAVGYSITNLALRDLSGRHPGAGWDTWISAMKAVPTFVIAVVMVWRRKRMCPDERVYPSWRSVGVLCVAALVMQYGGNLGFQVALRYIGLAVTVPLVFAMIIVTGAAVGKLVLGDTVSRRSLVSVALMLVSIILLSYAATQGQQARTESAPLSTSLAWVGVLIAAVSGAAYGLNGVVIRRYARNAMSVEAVLLVFSFVGIVTLSIPGIAMMGLDEFSRITLYEWAMMLVAGTFNAIAFFAVSWALKLANITLVNVVNATQNAMCAAGAVLVFGEPLTVSLVAGIILSITGLAVLYQRQPESVQSADQSAAA